MNNFGEKVSFIWSVADLLRGPYRPNQYKDVMLPMTVLRRLDWVLEPTKAKVMEKLKGLEGGTRLAIVFNGSAGSGESEIHGWISDNEDFGYRRITVERRAVGPRSSFRYELANGFRSHMPLDLSITWEDDSGEPGDCC